MACYVCDGAKLKCSMGSQESALTVLHPTTPVRVKGKPVAAMMDNKPFINIKPFGQCRSLANPTVAAATSANNGRLQPMPCIPNTTSPWMGTKLSALMKSQQALLDSSKLMCMWAGMIEITDPGQDMIRESGTPIRSKTDSVKSEAKAGNLAVAAGSGEEPEDSDGLTIKDFAEVLERIEKKKNCYESARHYAAYHVDYWTLTKLARRYVDETDAEKKDKEKDNDPNLMPSRFMLLYGADDDKLRANGHLDLHPDDFVNPSKHEVNVANLRKALILLGYDVAETGPFDEKLLYTFLKYLNPFGRVELDYVYHDKDSAEKPLNRVAGKYGAATWKFFYDEYDEKEYDSENKHTEVNDDGEEKNGADNVNVNHGHIKDKLNTDLGDKLIIEKGGTPHDYRSSISYHYPWVPFRMVVNMGEDYQEKDDATYEIYDRKSDVLLGEGPFRKPYIIECLLPDSKGVMVVADGVVITPLSKSTVVHPSQETMVENVTTPSEETEKCLCKTYNLIWGNKVNCEFRKKVVEISRELWPDNYLEMANNLMAVFAWESGNTFKAGVPNTADSGATGLIQFMPKTAAWLLGVDVKKLTIEYTEEFGGKRLKRIKEFAEMTEVKQLDYVKKYFTGLKGKKLEFVDFYLQVLFPASSGGNDDHIVFAESRDKLTTRQYESEDTKNLRVKAYSQNSGLDSNRDGVVWKSEIKEKVQKYITQGEKNRAIIFECK